MFRWDDVEDKEINEMTVKMYRNPFAAAGQFVGIFQDIELDHYAYKYLGSEIYMYKILDVNFERYREERGDVSRIGDIIVPTQEDTSKTIL